MNVDKVYHSSKIRDFPMWAGWIKSYQSSSNFSYFQDLLVSFVGISAYRLKVPGLHVPCPLSCSI